VILAVTGATGFVGGHLIQRALDSGHRVRALTRRAQATCERVEWIAGALDNPAALARLVAGADAIVHLAGAVSAGLAGFIAANVEGTRAVLDAAEGAGVRRFVHVSSLSAREPQLSHYGWSKREGEKLVEASALDWTIVRPTGVYGPGDTEMRDMFRMARLGVALLPPPGRVSLVAVEDLAALLMVLAVGGEARTVYEVDDGRVMTHAELAHAIGAAIGQRVLPMHLPRPLLSLAAALDTRLRGPRAKLTRDRVGYLCHPDWTADPARRPPPQLWTPTTPTAEGLAATARWYRANGMV
jgi:nucleoside-diphosphate-sugar epimerase